jgi:hypothetical protein
MYLDTKEVGLIRPERIGRYRAETWSVECVAAEGAFLTRGRSPSQRTRINVHFWDGVVGGYSRLQTAGRWIIYRVRYSGSPPKLVGFAVRRSSTRWDVVARTSSFGWIMQRQVGHTMGPDGPAAATALLTVC